MQLVQHGLELELVKHGAGGVGLVLLKAVAVLAGGADGYNVETMHALVGEVAVDLHAGQDGDLFVGVVLVIIDAVVGERQEVIAVLHMEADDVLGAHRAVGARGVAMQAALEQAGAAGESCLTNHVIISFWSALPPFGYPDCSTAEWQIQENIHNFR